MQNVLQILISRTEVRIQNILDSNFSFLFSFLLKQVRPTKKALITPTTH